MVSKWVNPLSIPTGILPLELERSEYLSPSQMSPYWVTLGQPNQDITFPPVTVRIQGWNLDLQTLSVKYSSYRLRKVDLEGATL